MTPLRLLYRGSLKSCNYGCAYCPFAKERETRQEQARDRGEVERFVAWIAQATHRRWGVLFTPWGEALVRPWYQRALARLSRLPHVERVAIQTNLSGPLEWTADADRDALALWATYHPGEVARERFLARCRELDRRGVRYSVGVVGLGEHLPEIEALRAALPPRVYLWVNAFKRDPARAAPATALEAIDPWYGLSAVAHPSRGEACRTGATVLSVDGAGDLRRCHFVGDRLANLYEPGWEAALGPRPCPAAECRCFIGYAHLERLDLEAAFGEGILERIPRPDRWPPR